MLLLNALSYITFLLILMSFFNAAPTAESSPAAAQSQLPALFLKCHGRPKNEMNGCMKDLLNEIFHTKSEGIPEIGLFPFDPLHVDAMKVNMDTPEFSVFFAVSDVKAIGLSAVDIYNFQLDYDKSTCTIQYLFPDALLKGKYVLKAKIGPLGISGDGTFWTSFTNINATLFFTFAKNENANGKPGLRITSIDMKAFDMEKINLRLNNLMNGDAVLQDAMNAFLNLSVKEMMPFFIPFINDNLNIIPEMVNLVLQRWNGNDIAGFEYIK